MVMRRSERLRGPQSARLRAALYYARQRRLGRLAASSDGGVSPTILLDAVFTDSAVDNSSYDNVMSPAVGGVSYDVSGGLNLTRISGEGLFILDNSQTDLAGRTNFDIEIDFSSGSIGGSDTLLGKSNVSANERQFRIRRNTAGFDLLVYPTGAGAPTTVISNISAGLVVDDRVLFKLTKRGDDYEMFLDGVSIGTATNAVVWRASTGEMTIGNFEVNDTTAGAGQDPFLGVIHSIKITDPDQT